MSSNGPEHSSADTNTPLNALDVGFASLGRRQGESSSQSESRSEGKRSIRSAGSSKGERVQDGKPISPGHGAGQRRVEEKENGVGHRSRRSGGFLLDSVFANGSPKGGDVVGKRKGQDGQLRVEKRRRPASNRFSGDSSQRNSPLSKEVSLDGQIDGNDDEDEERESVGRTSRPPSLDPAQLVQMALSLSESRRRHASGSLHVPSPSSGRVVSMPISNYGTVRSSSGARKRSSMMSDAVPRDSPRSNHSPGQHYEYDGVTSSSGMDNIVYNFSPATLSRAERARRYFELASEHRRLLQHLPPLKPDASAPDNYTFETRSTPGSAFPDIQRVTSGTDGKHALGRMYNPIQGLRNRRVRIREKRPFPAPPDTWADMESVRRWIDEVESATADPFYRATRDQAQLPPYSGDDGTSVVQPGSQGHRRTDTVGSVIIRPENSWTIEPTELLADTYWTEKGSNKTYIENRHGNPIFSQPGRKSIDTPRISVDMPRHENDLAKAGVDSADFEESGRPSRRRRLMRPLLLQSDTHTRKHRRLISRSPSESSGSDTEGHISRGASGDDNIGPLERHMQELIAKEESGELASPELTSPDHWDARPLPHPRGSLDSSHSQGLSRPNGRSSLEVPRDMHRRSRSADGRVNSFDKPSSPLAYEYDSDSTAPDAQTDGLLASTAPQERRSLDSPRPQMLPQLQAPKLPSFRSRSKDRNSLVQSNVAAATASALSPILSGDSWRPRSSQETDRPLDFRRHKTNDSMAASLHRLDTSTSSAGTFHSTREPSSTVGRLFKGGRDRISRLRNRDKPESYRGVSDASDVEDVDGPDGYLRKWRGADSPGDESDASPRESLDQTRSKQKYQLPAFTSAARDRRMVPGTPITASTNPFERDKEKQEDGGKGQKLVRPRLDIPEEGDNASAAPMAKAIRFDTSRKSYGDLGLDAPLPIGHRTLSRSPGRRHWSIYDQAQTLQPTGRISARDIASVRTLLLCSGIKAREIQRRANTPRDPIPPDVLQAAETAGRSAPTVALKDEFVVAARMLSTRLSSSFSTFESALSDFQSGPARHLASSLDELQQRASEQLATQVHDASDEADAFIVELTTRQPQQTKRVDDAVDLMVRRRRRQFWFLRQAGFKLLEWLVLGLMWWIWFLVVMFNMVRRSVVGVGRLMRWLVVF